MAATQRDCRRFFAHLFISHSALVLVGLDLVEDHHLEVICVTGALALWFSVMLTLGSFGLIMRALEARFGRLSLTGFRGLYDHSPTLAVCFLITGLASIGFPGTIGFISIEILVDGTVEPSPWIGFVVAILAALNGIAVVRAYLILFTGTRHASTVSLGIGARERFAVIVLISLIVGGGLFPQPFVTSRYRAAESVLKDREAHVVPGKSPASGQ
ncbi:MAG: hypothetical protein EXS09_04750 [Gemmataceae bacterium]|nr:hypothetical protein [Gemmataceae bacterium]